MKGSIREPKTCEASRAYKHSAWDEATVVLMTAMGTVGRREPCPVDPQGSGLDPPQQCASKASMMSHAISSGPRPSIWNRSSMNTGRPSLKSAIDGDDGRKSDR